MACQAKMDGIHVLMKSVRERIMTLVEYFEQYMPLKAGIKAFIEERTHLKNFRKGEILFENPSEIRPDGEETIFYVESGIVRVFYAQVSDRPTMRFLTETTFSSTIEYAMFEDIPLYQWEALTDTQVCYINYRDFEDALLQFPELEKLLRTELMRMLLEYQKIAYQNRTLSATERFHILMEERPEVILHCKGTHIASYLGITPQALSKLRSARMRMNLSEPGVIYPKL